MTIECYYDTCIWHSTQDGEDGPFCDEQTCLASKKELQQFEMIRQEYLRGLKIWMPNSTTSM